MNATCKHALTQFLFNKWTFCSQYTFKELREIARENGHDNLTDTEIFEVQTAADNLIKK